MRSSRTTSLGFLPAFASHAARASTRLTPSLSLSPLKSPKSATGWFQPARLFSSSPPATHPFHYQPIWDVERLELYTPGGYHPVAIGDAFIDKYRVVDKLGHGGYSTVWLARDMVLSRYVALKVGVSDRDTSSREADVLCSLLPPSTQAQPGSDCIPRVFDQFDIHGPNGMHHCYAMTLARSSVSKACEMYMFPLDVARVLCGQLAVAVAYIHAQGYVHGDLHLGNILLAMPSNFDQLSIGQFYKKYGEPETEAILQFDGQPPPSSASIPTEAVIPTNLGIPAEKCTLADARILLSDFGESFSPKNGEVRQGKDCYCPISARPPETQHSPTSPYSYPADIWMLALCIWNIMSVKALFSNSGLSTPDDLTAQQIDLFGPLPAAWHKAWLPHYSRYFDEETGRRKDNGARLWASLDEAFEGGLQKWRREQPEMGVVDEEAEKLAFLRLIRRMLAYKPEDRPTIEEVLASEWMVKWAIPRVDE